MAKNETRRLNPAVLAEDLEIFAALKDIEEYKPANLSYTVAAITAIDTRRVVAHDKEVQTTAAADAARDDHVAVQWEMHNAILGAKDQVVAQFGLDSNQAQAMKLKKKSVTKTPPANRAAAQHPHRPKPRVVHRHNSRTDF